MQQNKKGNSFFFTFSMLSLLFQTVLTFVLLFNASQTPKIQTAIKWLFGIFLGTLAIVTLMSRAKKRYSKEAVSMYKTSMKFVKYVLKLLMIAISVLNIFSAKSLNVFAFVSSIVSLVLVVISISVDVFILKVKYRWSKFKKQFVKNREQNKERKFLEKHQRANESASDPEFLIGRTVEDNYIVQSQENSFEVQNSQENDTEYSYSKPHKKCKSWLDVFSKNKN